MNLDLAPVIQSIEICRDEQNLPRHLLLRGSNLSAARPAHAIVDGAFSPGLQEHSQTAVETLVRIPDPRAFNYNRTHQVIYTTPHGIAIKRF